MDAQSLAQAPDDEVDRAALTRLASRFRHHHQLRLKRTGDRLMARQRRVLEALPMLYHRNHPALPGYVGPDTPSGIDGYRPNPDELAAVRRVARTYEEPPGTGHADIQAMFIMGSGGTVGQSRGSDIDLWVCCDTLLHSTLWPKVRMIDQWAADLGLELHTFLVDPDVLRIRQRLPGTRIPSLVLDEFYRSGALMAGRFPLWWLISETDPDAYRAVARRLIERRFVDPEAIVDFGPVPHFPADELAQAAITELDRALTTPHKSLLKLKLIEAYARTPGFGTVSSAYKARVHAGEQNPLRLDPYLLLYDHVQTYLEHSGRTEELDFVRGLLIGKAAENARVPHLASAASEDQSALMERFLGWGFSVEDVARFRSLDSWSMTARLAEHGRVMAALEGGLELVEGLVTKAAGEVVRKPSNPLDVPDDGRQLHWLNETRLRHLQYTVNRLRGSGPDSIPELHPALVGRRSNVPLQLDADADGWTALDQEGPVQHRQRLVEIAVWAELNGATLMPRRPEPELTRNLAQILQGFRGPHRDTYVFVNAETPSEAAAQEPLLSLPGDPLAHVGQSGLDAASFDVVTRDSSGHWSVSAIASQSAARHGIGELLARPPGTVSWQVIGSQSRFTAAHRLEQLHALASHFLEAPGAVFVLPLADVTLTLRRTPDEVDVASHDSIDALLTYMRRHRCATVGFDPADARLRDLLRAG